GPDHHDEKEECDIDVVDLFPENDPGPADVQWKADATGTARPAFFMNDQQAHNLEDGNSGQRKERAFQAQGRVTDDHGDQAGNNGACEHADPRRNAEVLGEQRGGVAAYPVEDSVAERQLPRVAAYDVPGDGQGREYEQQDKEIGPEGTAHDHRNQEHDGHQDQADIGLRATEIRKQGALLLFCAKAKQAVRTHDKYQQENAEVNDFFQVGRDVVASQCVDNADDHGAGDRAIKAAHAAKHHDDKCGQDKVSAYCRENRVLGREQAGRNADKSRSKSEGDDIHVLDVDAH